MNNSSFPIAAAILAGGKNKRMAGKNKAFIKIDGLPLIQRTIGNLKEIFQEIIIVTNSPQEFRLYEKGAFVTSDIIKNIGPLGGIYSALNITSRKGVFFVACDMPFVHNALIKQQLNKFAQIDCDALVPRISSRLEPIHAIYKKSLKTSIGRFIEKNSEIYSIREFLRTVNTYYWDLEDNPFNRKIFSNVNTPDDFNQFNLRG